MVGGKVQVREASRHTQPIDSDWGEVPSPRKHLELWEECCGLSQ